MDETSIFKGDFIRNMFSNKTATVTHNKRLFFYLLFTSPEKHIRWANN